MSPLEFENTHTIRAADSSETGGTSPCPENRVRLHARRDVDERWRMVAVVALANLGIARSPSIRVRYERHHCERPTAATAVPRRQMGRALEFGLDLLDDRACSVGLVCGDGV